MHVTYIHNGIVYTSLYQTLTSIPGVAGFLLGGTAGILATPTPFLFASFSSLQWFTLGTTFWTCRSSLLQTWKPQEPTPSDLIKVSTLSGGVTGGVVAALMRGRRNVLPGMLMFSLAGAAGQWIHNVFDAAKAREAESGTTEVGLGDRLRGKGWSLMKVMSDKEYAERLKKQQLVADAEIAVLDDKIMALREQQQQELGADTVSASPIRP